MSHTFTFTVEVTLDRSQGKFVSREDMAAELQEAIESADPGSVDIDESSYDVTGWDVTES